MLLHSGISGVYAEGRTVRTKGHSSGLESRMAARRGGGQVASRVCSPLDGVLPDNAPKSGIIYVGEISCIPSYLHQLRKTGGGNFATAAGPLRSKLAL